MTIKKMQFRNNQTKAINNEVNRTSTLKYRNKLRLKNF